LSIKTDYGNLRRMFDDNLRSKFQITVKGNNGVFEASCSGFPEYIGTGKDEQTAIEDLATHLADRVGDVVKKTLDDLLHSGVIKSTQLYQNLLEAQSVALKELGLAKKNTPLIARKKIELSPPRSPIAAKTGMMLMGFSPAAGMPSGVERFEDISFSSSHHDDFDEEGMMIGIPFSFN